MYSDQMTGVGYAALTPAMEQRLSNLAHSYGRCAGFESLESQNPNLEQVKFNLTQIRTHRLRAQQYSAMRIRQTRFNPNPDVQKAIAELNAQNLHNWVDWMAKFPSRYNKASDPNVHVRALVEQLKGLAVRFHTPLQVDVISHTSTKQQSIHVRLEGSSRPKEVIVLGAHFDSINMYGGGNAPGADDNASGSSNLLEALRVLLTQSRPARTIEFFWYAGEESGLLGSAEIARSYKENNVDVVAVLQLDMTLFPGAGKGQLGLMTDYTSPWLQDLLKGLNDTYVGARVIESQCGYGCSDHASWFRQGYPAVIPFEATFNTMNHLLHTPKDVVNSSSDFEHSLMFSKLALAMALELGNSTQRQPFQ